MIKFTLFRPLKLERHWDLSRRLIKTLTWRLIGTTSTFLISYFITGKLSISSGIAITQMVTGTILYYVHEMAWDKFSHNSPQQRSKNSLL